MRLVTFWSSERNLPDPRGEPRAGVIVADGSVVAVRDLVSGAPDDMTQVIWGGDALLGRLRDAAKSARGGTMLESARLLAPIPTPRRNVFCVGWNYSEHFKEGADFRARQGTTGPEQIPEFPSLFSKNPATVSGPAAPVWFPAPHSSQLDWECELAVIIGPPGTWSPEKMRDIAEADAMQYVFGYTCANDVSVRDVQRRHGGQWFKGKNFDSHLPMGPWIVTADELDPSDLAIQTRVNGVTKQDSRTSYMVFKIPRLIREFSAGCEMRPGDIIITGTPSGVGFARTPPEWLKVGDVMEIEIEGIGVLRNTVEGRS
jgi:2-keto-4-pentenoate hydratase/2-oxohepta-3-ene-1,7-dioic acid hydratase in catechol pathway